MNLAPANVQLSFEVTFDSASLNVAMTVFDVTGASPVVAQGPTAMTLVSDYTYQGKFIPVVGHIYVILKAVYTDGTFVTLSPDYAQGSESIAAQDIGGGGGSSSSDCGALLGLVVPNDTIIGLISC